MDDISLRTKKEKEKTEEERERGSGRVYRTNNVLHLPLSFLLRLLKCIFQYTFDAQFTILTKNACRTYHTVWPPSESKSIARIERTFGHDAIVVVAFGRTCGLQSREHPDESLAADI